MTKMFTVKKFGDFVSWADETNDKKCVDIDKMQAWFYHRKRIQYDIKDKDELDKLTRHGFVEGSESEIYDSW